MLFRSITLLPESGDRFYNANGEGYYDPPTLRKERWTFTVNHHGQYRIEVKYKPGRFSRLININVNGRVFRTSLYGDEKASAIAGVAELTASPNVVLTVTPAAPFETGAALDVDLTSISLVPLNTQSHTGNSLK